MAAVVSLLGLGLGLPRPARADGALPGSLGIMLPADRPQEILLATTFGMILSTDGGASWFWTCEAPAIANGYLYSMGPPSRDRIYGLSPTEGLAYSDDGTCSWQRSGGILGTAVASDYFVDRTNPERVLAIAASQVDDGDGGVTTSPQSVYASADGGLTFGATPLYTAPANDNVVGIEISRSDPDVIYLAMYSYPGVRHPVLVRSGDGGQTWTPTDVEAGLGANAFRILAVDPDDPNLLYLRVIAPGVESVAVTRDGGLTFSTPVSVPNGALSAFARLASGTVLVAALTNLPGGGGGTTGSAFRSTDGGRTFTPWVLCPEPHILGLGERAGVLYLAGKNYSDGWALATSTDEGVTIQPFSRYEQVRGVQACPQQACASACTFVESQAVFSDEVCTGALLDGGAVPPGPSPGVCSADGSSDGAAPPPASSGCHCSAAPSGGRGGAFGAAFGLLAAIALSLRRASNRTRSSVRR